MNQALNTFAQSLFSKHETRMYRKEKDVFLEHCKAEFTQLGYDEVVIKEEKNALGMTSRNLVAGPLDADVLITAHYDTPGRNGFLLFFNPLFGGLLGSMLLMVLLVFLPRFLEGAIENGAQWVNYAQIALGVVFIASFLLKNKHNHNDNTSGVIGVYQMAQLIAQNPELKDRCAFVLFDHEEVLPGLLGSKAFAKWRRRNHPDKAGGVVINLDCIGLGNVLTVMTKKKHQGWHDIAAFLEQEGFSVKKVRGGMTGTSDHAPFSAGVSLLFQKPSILGPLFIPNIHSGKDKTCDLDQLARLCDGVYAYLGRA